MRILLQRVRHAQVAIAERIIAEIAAGLLMFVCIESNDTEAISAALAEKCVRLRIFSDDAGKMNRALCDVGGAALIVSQFTLAADCRTGRRPSFTGAAAPDLAVRLCDHFVTSVRALGIPTHCGQFGADMQITLCNDGPVTVWLDSTCV